MPTIITAENDRVREPVEKPIGSPNAIGFVGSLPGAVSIRTVGELYARARVCDGKGEGGEGETAVGRHCVVNAHKRIVV